VVNTYVNAIKKAGENRKGLARALFDRIPKNKLDKIKKYEVLATSGLYSSLMQIYLAYLCGKNACSWPSGRSLKEVLHENLNNDPLSVHHIFPKKFMQDRDDLPIERLNSVANYAILTQADNSELSVRDPFDVWRSLKTNQREWAAIQMFFTAREDLFKIYEEFVEFRAEKLAEQLNIFLAL
jgi:hypothetical protein